MFFKEFLPLALTLNIVAIIFLSSCNGAPLSISSRSQFEKVYVNDRETFIRRTDKLNTTKCIEIILPPNRKKDQVQVVLQGFFADGGGEFTDSCLALTDSSTAVTRGMFQAYPLHQRSIIKMCEIPRCRSSVTTADLQILVLSPGECNSNMLSFRGNCYAVSSIKKSAGDVMSNLGGSAQLASFNDMAQINDFIKANNERLDKPPYNRNFDFKSPIRIGLFYSPEQAKMFSIGRSEDGSCGLDPALKFSDLLLTNSTTRYCAALKVVNSEQAKVELDDCNELRLSLLSFPDTSPEFSSVPNCITPNMLQVVNKFAKQQTNVSEVFETINGTSTGREETNGNEWDRKGLILSIVVGLVVAFSSAFNAVQW